MEKTILLVDDEADVRDVLSISLEDLGYHVICAESGLKAIDLFKEHQPAIVLTDIKMPHMDGIELLEKIKQINPETEVIMITGHGDMNFAISSFRFDATDFITKPIGIEALERALERAEKRITVRRQFKSYTENLELLLGEKSKLLQAAGKKAFTPTVAEAIDTVGADVQTPAKESPFQQVVNRLPCYISLYDKELNITAANSYFTESFGDVVGRSCYAACKQRSAPCPDCPVKKTFDNGKSFQHETEYITIEGAVREVLVWTFPVPGKDDGDLQQVMALAVDLFQISELQDHLSSLGLMMGSLSHGIKGMLTGMDSGMYLLNSGMAKKDEDRTREGFEIIRQTSDRLKRMVLDILFYAKEREYKKERVPVKDFADNISRIVASRIKTYDIFYKEEFGENLGDFEIDAGCMLQALINIFENAINACQADTVKTGHEIVLRVFAENGLVCFTIQDNGTGMSEETRANMFNLFFSTKGSQGTGLGLFITRKIIQEHGGEIQAESTLGQGTRIKVSIPRDNSPA